MLLSISFTFANRFIGEIWIKCGFIVQYESIFENYLARNKILSCILKIRYCQASILHITAKI